MPIIDEQLRTEPYQAEGTPLISAGGRALRLMWRRFFVFLLPIFGILGPAIYWVDPFALFRHVSPVPMVTREWYGRHTNQTLWKVLAFGRNPAPNVLLGDSQMAQLPEQEVDAVTGKTYANMAYAGGTLRESISTFWFVAGRTNLRQVYFGMSFMAYDSYPRNRVPQAVQILDNHAMYFVNSDVMETGYYDVADRFFRHQTVFAPGISKEAFWKIELQQLEQRYKHSTGPGALRDELRKVLAYCRSHGIAFAFVITPQSVDAQRRVPELGVKDRYLNFKNDLAAIAPVYDCDIETSFTENNRNFSDPFHLEPDAARRFVRDLWSGHPSWCRMLWSD
jgi:hypothetical protein